MPNTFRRSIVVAGFLVAASLSGCSSNQDTKDETATSSEAISYGVNVVTADCLHLRTSDSPTGSAIGCMSFCSHFDVHSIDWGTGMAYGFSWQLGRWGWANKNYLTGAGCIYGGGTD